MSPILFRSIAKLYLSAFALVLVGVTVVYLVADFGDRLNTFLEHSIADIAELYWHKVLIALHQLAPAAMLLAAGATVSVLRKRSEWTAMQALGASRWTIVGPVLVSAGVVAAGLIAFDEWVVTRSGERVDHLMANRFGRWGDYGFFYFPKQWFRVGSTIVHVRGETESSGRLRDVTLYRLDEAFHLTSRVDGTALSSLGGDRWLVEEAVERTFEHDGQSPLSRTERLEVSLPGSEPRTFRIRSGRPEQMAFDDLRVQREIRAKVGLPVQRFWLALHNRFAYPVTGLSAAFLALCLALRPARKGHLTLALIEGLVVSVVLFTFMLIGKAMVMGDHVAPGVAAWAPIAGLVFASVVLWRWSEQLPPFALKTRVRDGTR